jgi:MFS family permease
MQLSCALIGLHFGATLLSAALPAQLAGFFFRGGVQAASTLTTVALTELVPRAELAPAVALFATTAGIAAIVAPPVGGWLFGWWPAAPFVAGLAILVAAMPLVGRAYRSAP